MVVITDYFLNESLFGGLLAKLQTEVRRLQESLEEKRHSRLELSETILQDAKSRLDSFRNSVNKFSQSLHGIS